MTLIWISLQHFLRSIRDGRLLSPLIFRKDIYAMACVVGGVFYWFFDLLGMEPYICQIVGGVGVFVTRILAVKYQICLPILSGETGGEDRKEN